MTRLIPLATCLAVLTIGPATASAETRAPASTLPPSAHGALNAQHAPPGLERAFRKGHSSAKQLSSAQQKRLAAKARRLVKSGAFRRKLEGLGPLARSGGPPVRTTARRNHCGDGTVHSYTGYSEYYAASFGDYWQVDFYYGCYVYSYGQWWFYTPYYYVYAGIPLYQGWCYWWNGSYYC
jgi:hypothetical protein